MVDTHKELKEVTAVDAIRLLSSYRETFLLIFVAKNCDVCKKLIHGVEKHLDSGGQTVETFLASIATPGETEAVINIAKVTAIPTTVFVHEGVERRRLEGSFNDPDNVAEKINVELKAIAALHQDNNRSIGKKNTGVGFIESVLSVVRRGGGNVALRNSRSRLMICRGCSLYRHRSETCKLCGCNMKIKASFKGAECPLQKW